MDKNEIYNTIGLLYDQSLIEDSKNNYPSNYRWEVGLSVFGILYSDCLATSRFTEEPSEIETNGELWGYPVDVNPKAPTNTLKLWKEIK